MFVGVERILHPGSKAGKPQQADDQQHEYHSRAFSATKELNELNWTWPELNMQALLDPIQKQVRDTLFSLEQQDR